VVHRLFQAVASAQPQTSTPTITITEPSRIDKNQVSTDLVKASVTAGPTAELGVQDPDSIGNPIETWLVNGALDPILGLQVSDSDSQRIEAMARFLRDSQKSGQMGYLMEFNYHLPQDFRFSEQGKVTGSKVSGIRAGKVFYVQAPEQGYPLALQWALGLFQKERDRALAELDDEPMTYQRARMNHS